MTKVSLSPAYETERVAALHQLQILDTEAEEDFDDIAALASQICETPMAVISFTDEDRSWFKSKVGVECDQVPRSASLSAGSLANDNDSLLIINDCRKDERFINNPLVIGDHNICFFAGVPLVNDDGYTLGFLCVLDHVPGSLSAQQQVNLRILGRQVLTLLKLRLQIIKLKKAEEEARISEERMNNIFHNAIDAVVVMDEDGVISQWNPKAESIFGWSANEAIGQYFHELVIPEAQRRKHLETMQALAQASDDQVPNNIQEISAMRRNKSLFEIKLGVSHTISKGSRSFICFISDITERKLATKKLDQQKEFYENILNNLPTDIAVFDANHKYLFVNPGAINVEEYRKFIIGKDDFEYCEYRHRDKSLAELRRAMFLEVKTTKKEIRWEDTVTNPDGNPITSLRRIFPVFGEDGELNMVIGFGLDITDRKVLEEKQTALVKQLSLQNTQLVDFCNIVSHNLRAPLVNMSMLVQFIDETDDMEEQKQLIARLNPVVENLHNTFNELVESIQIKQDLEIRSEQIKLADCTKKILEGLEVEIGKSEAEIDLLFDEAPVVFYPAKYMSSILHNIISNALKYQSPKRKPVIKVESRKVDDKIILSVTDNGLGIDLNKHKDNIFKIGKVFHRHPNAKGFGLFMTKTQVEAMDGRVWLESTPDEGSTFFIEFKNQNG